MRLSLGGLRWRLSCDEVVSDAVARVFGVDDAAGPDGEAADIEVTMRVGSAEEVAHWTAFRAQHDMDMDAGILRFTLSDGRAGRLSSVSLEMEGGGSEVEWVWLADPSDIVTRGGSLLLNVFMRRWRSDWFPVHGAVIGRDGAFVLVPGASGAGKSTLTASALAAGRESTHESAVESAVESMHESAHKPAPWQIIGDDFVWVRRAGDGSWQAEGPYAGLRLTPAAREMVAKCWPGWTPTGFWTPRGDGKWVGFPEQGIARAGRLVGVLGIAPSAAPGEVQAVEAPSELMAAFRTSMLLLNASGAQAGGYLSACRRLLEELPKGMLPRSPQLDMNLIPIDRWLSSTSPSS